MQGYKSQIRTSTINSLKEKVSRKNYGKYLLKLNIANVRALREQIITFDFPVSALIGPNGGGKTTILGAAATAYASVKPRQFFAKSGKFDESMTNWKVEYELIDRSINRTDTVRRTAAFHKSKWSRDAVDRFAVILGVSRTVPANERKELQRCASGTFEVADGNVGAIRQSVADAVQKILGKSIADYSHIKIDTAGRVSLLTGSTGEGTRYSEFHFGAGESSIIRMIMEIEAAPENSLILIEEIENGLHPVATVRLVEYLIEAADRKAIQAIFTTHSNDALLPLPPEAIWASINGKVFQGKLDISSLRAITGQINASLAIFCEDEFAAAWVRSMLRARRELELDGVEVHAMAGDGTAVTINRHHNLSPAKRFPSSCVIDGDSKQLTSDQDHVYRLPGECPEAYVFDRVLEAADASGRLTIRLSQPFAEAARLIERLREIRRTNRDPHLLFSQVGEALGFIPVEAVQEAFFTTWAEAYPTEVDELIEKIRALLPAGRVALANA
ncbi:ATP-dependent nuclease [Dokdonella ginsengisoli]|uniref:ATP-dependent endonuclease n=1 Tax=Dokdonella ginsengisoli TaxID=363846 RepID=A0ABV9QY81_9GAMM